MQEYIYEFLMAFPMDALVCFCNLTNQMPLGSIVAGDFVLKIFDTGLLLFQHCLTWDTAALLRISKGLNFEQE